MTEKLKADAERSPIRDRMERAAMLIDGSDGYYRLRNDQSASLPDESAEYEETKKYGKELDAYFRYHINYYPHFDEKVAWWNPFSWKYFALINEGMTEDKFPRDHDIRTLITAYRFTIEKNQFRNIRIKRFAQGFMSLVLFLPALAYGWAASGGQAPSALSLPASATPGYWLQFGVLLAVAAILFHLFIRNTSSHARKATEANAKSLGSKIQHRLNNLAQNYSRFMRNIATVEFEGLDMDRAEWTQKGKWWAMLALWTPKRIEYIEKFLQSEMQRMRIFTLWSDLLGNVVSLVVFAVISLVAAGVLYVVTHASGAPDAAHLSLAWWLYAGGVVLSLAAALYSMAGHASMSVASISNWIGHNDWGRFKDIGLHEDFGEVIRQAKEQIRQDKLHGGWGSVGRGDRSGDGDRRDH